MTMAPDIATDLVTPLGAYVRLRREGPSGVPARVRRARPARPSLARRLRLAALLPRRRRRPAGSPVVGYLAYDYAARLEPTVPLPDDGTGLPESRFLVADVLIRFDHVLGTAR